MQVRTTSRATNGCVLSLVLGLSALVVVREGEGEGDDLSALVAAADAEMTIAASSSSATTTTPCSAPPLPTAASTTGALPPAEKAAAAPRGGGGGDGGAIVARALCRRVLSTRSARRDRVWRLLSQCIPIWPLLTYASGVSSRL